jgi:hypothetical protein
MTDPAINMEENFTRQKTDTINITIYAESDSKPTAAVLNQQPFAEEKNNRRFSFKAKDIGLVNIPKSSDIAIVIAPEDDVLANELYEKLRAQKNPRLRIIEGYDNLFEKVSSIALQLEKALELGLSLGDFLQVKRRNIDLATIESQLSIFSNGIAKISLERPAVLKDGITAFSKDDIANLAIYFDSRKNNYKLKKFVPASGAATRMFKFLHDFIANYDPNKETINGYINRKKDNSLEVFLLGLERFPFYDAVSAEAEKHVQYPDHDDENVREDARNYSFIKNMISE